MPQLSEFFGIRISIRTRETPHHRPHFHARYAGEEVSIAIDTMKSSLEASSTALSCWSSNGRSFIAPNLPWRGRPSNRAASPTESHLSFKTMNRYFTEKVTAIAPLDGHRLRVTFADGFIGEVDLSPLLETGPIFAPWRDLEFFRSVKPVCGVPEWSDAIDLSPGALRAWCEAGRFLEYDETDAWVAEHTGAAQDVA